MSGLKFKLERDHLKKKLKELKPYTTKQEKDLLLLDDDEPYEKVLDILAPGVKVKNILETFAYLIYLRMISVSDLFEGLIECPKCKTTNDLRIELNEVLILDPPELDGCDSLPIGFFETVEEVLSEEDSDNLSINDYNELQDALHNNILKIFNITQYQNCRVCRNDIEINLAPRTILSKSTVSSIYKEYFALGMYLHYTNRDVDELLPFERELYFKMVQKKIETPPTPGM